MKIMCQIDTLQFYLMMYKKLLALLLLSIFIGGHLIACFKNN